VPSNSSIYRHLRLANDIKAYIGEYLLRECQDKALKFVSISKVDLSSTNQDATIYCSYFDTLKLPSLMKLIEKNSPLIRKYLASKLKTYCTPKLHFVIDNTLQVIDEVDSLLAKKED